MKFLKGLCIQKLINIFYLFLGGAVIGWLYEVILHLVRDGVFVNRGMLHGSWLPIYGIGCVLMVYLKKLTGGKPVFYFSACFIASAILEYTASWLMELIYHTRWWDYSNLPLNINGRIFIGGLFGFALAGCLLVYVFLPIMEKVYHKIPYIIVNLIARFLAVIFILDVFFSMLFPNIGAGITL